MLRTWTPSFAPARPPQIIPFSGSPRALRSLRRCVEVLLQTMAAIYPTCFPRNSNVLPRASLDASASYDPRWSQLKPCPAL